MDAILTNMSKQVIQFSELKSPADLGSIKVADVKKWNAWKEHHATIHHWYEKYS